MKHVFYPLFAFLFTFGTVFGVDASQIAALHDRTQASTQTLTDRDKGVIADFWRRGLDELMLSHTSRDAVDVRDELVRYAGTEKLSDYRAAYVAEGAKDLPTAFVNLERLENPQQRIMIKRNLMILAAELQSLKVSDIALARVADEDPVVRYWAVKSLTQSSIIQALSSDLNKDEITASILHGLSDRSSVEDRPEILEMICSFCMAVNTPDARQILQTLCDRRTKACQAWQPVETELDIRVLEACGNIAAVESDAGVKSKFAQKFSILYSLFFQRLMIGGDQLSETEADDIRTVIAEIDQNLVIKVMEIRTDILRPLRQNNMNLLKVQYEALFGDRLRPGQLETQYNFDYGKDASGKAMTAPPELKLRPNDLKTEQ